MTDPFARLNDLMRQLSRTGSVSDAAKVQEETRAVQEDVTGRLGTTATAEDATAQVEATVRVDGTVDRLYVSPMALRNLSDEELGQACVEAITLARGESAKNMTAWLNGDEPPPPDA